MDVTLDKNINNYPQVKGFGEVITTFLLSINVGGILNLKDTRRFILSIELDINGYVYYYNNIYSIADVDQNGNLDIGNVTVLGKIDTPNINTKAKVVYLENPS